MIQNPLYSFLHSMHHFSMMRQDRKPGTRIALVLSCLCLALATMVSGCATVASTKPATTPAVVPSPSLILLAQGDLASYQTTGKKNWQIPVSSASASFPMAANGQNRTHLISNGHMLYTATDRLQATTTHGVVLWRQSLSDPADELLKVQNDLYVLAGTTLGTLSAWKSVQGKLLWLQPAASLPFGPWAPLASDGHMLFVGGENHVMALDAETGKIVWQDDLDPSDGDQQLFVAHGILVVQTGSKIMALQSATGAVLWQRESQIQALYINAAATLIYTASIDVPDPVTHPNAPIWSGLRASDLASGTQLWAVAQPLSVTGVSSISATGILYADSAAITEWSLEGTQCWQHIYAGSPITQIEAVSSTETDLLFAQDGTLMALNSQDGGQRWQQMESQTSQLAVVQQQYWIMSPADGEIAAYSTGGTKQWSLKLAPFEDIDIQ